MHTLFFYLYLLRQLILLLHRMKINLFYGYSDCNPKNTTLEEVFQLILNDASVKERTERHRYYLNQGLKKEAGYEKSGSICFSVATLFEGGKTQKHIVGWPGIGMVDIDDADEIIIDRLEEAAKKDPHTEGHIYENCLIATHKHVLLKIVLSNPLPMFIFPLDHTGL